MRLQIVIALGLLLGVGCVAVDGRAARSPAACAREVVAQLPPEWSDQRKHCVASALLVRNCSAVEARLAGWSKELRDALTSGDASRQDLQANAAGRRCGRVPDGQTAIEACCEAAGH